MVRRLSTRLLLAVVLAAALVPERVALADSRLRAEAERRNRTGSAMYREGRFEQALQMYQSAYDLVPDLRYLFNIGLAKEKIFDYEGCTLACEEFMRRTAETGTADVKQAAKSRMETCLERTVIPVRFTSVPTNAAVYIREGEEQVLRGRTPQELSLPPGEHEVIVTFPGYLAQEQVVSVAVGSRPQPDFVLEKLSSLSIEVDPSGARVQIGDGEWEAAPVTRQVRAGTHEVRIEKEGYEPSKREVSVESGQEVSLVLSLRERPKIRRLAIDALGVPGARVAIAGQPSEEIPTEKTLAPGDHRIEVRAPGHLPYASSISIPDDRDVKLLVSLTPERSGRDQVAMWSLAGAGALSMLTGLVYGALALSDQAKFNDDPTDVMLHERGQTRARRSDVWLGTGLLFGAGAAAYWYFTRPAPSDATIEY